jgi:nitrogen regulatory protein P-II 1
VKEIKAFIRPQKLDAVVDGLESRPHIPGLTVSEVRGWGHVAGEESARLTERIKLEIVVAEEDVADVVSLIVEKARTGHAGDGNIFVSDVGEAVRIRTGERAGDVIRPSRTESGGP